MRSSSYGNMRICTVLSTLEKSRSAASLNSTSQAILATDLFQADARAYVLQTLCCTQGVLTVFQIEDEGLADKIVPGLTCTVCDLFNLTVDLRGDLDGGHKNLAERSVAERCSLIHCAMY